MNSLIEHIYKTKLVEDPEGNFISAFPTSIPYEEGMTLYNLVRQTKSQNTLEIGMAYGLSTLFICQAHHDNGGGHHTAIDPLERTLWETVGLSNIRKCGLENILRFYEKPSHDVLPELLRQKERFDFIFIDGSHSFDYVLVDFFYADKILNSGGYMMFDDLWMPSIRKVLLFILRNRNYKPAPEFIWKLNSPLKRCGYLVWNMAKSSLEIGSILFSVSQCIKGLPNYCVIKKLSDDKRDWRHYKSF